MAGLQNRETKIDVVEREDEAFVETADPFEHRSRHEQARTGDGGDVLRDPQSLHVALSLARVEQVRVSGNAAHADYDARVLDRVVRVVELRADGSDAGLHGELHHRFEPVRVDGLGVVVEEEQQFAAGLRGREIVHRGVVERPRPLDDAHVRLLHQLAVISVRLGKLAAVLHDHDFVIRVARMSQRLDAPGE